MLGLIYSHLQHIKTVYTSGSFNLLDLWREFGFMYVTLFLLLDFSNNLSDTVIYFHNRVPRECNLCQKANNKRAAPYNPPSLICREPIEQTPFINSVF